MTGNPGNGGGGGAPGGTPPAAPPSWFSTLPADQQGYVQNKGWHSLDPSQAALSILNAYANLEKIHGVPAERMVTWPKDDADTEAWAKIHEKMGVPKDATGYNLADVKFKNGDPMDPANAAAFQKIAAELKLPPAAGKLLAQRLVEMTDGYEEDTSKAAATARGAATATLHAEWGQAAQSNQLLVDRALAASGLTLDMVRPEHQVGFMKGLLGVARGMSEATLLAGGQGGGDKSASMTAEQAQQELNMLKQDSDFSNRWLNGDANAAAKMRELHTIIAQARYAAMTNRPTP